LAAISAEEATTAPELDPARMVYIIGELATGGDAAQYNPTPAEIDHATAALILDDAQPEIVEAVRNVTGRDYAGSWSEDPARMTIATAGDGATVEAALASYLMDIEVVEVDFRRRQLNRWVEEIRDQSTPEAPVFASVDIPRNVIVAIAHHEATLDLSSIPCAAVEIDVSSQVNPGTELPLGEL